MAQVKVTIGVTINAGNYQNYRPEVELSRELHPGESFEQAHAELSEQARQMLIHQTRDLLREQRGYQILGALMLLGMDEASAGAFAYPEETAEAAVESVDYPRDDYDEDGGGESDEDWDGDEDESDDEDDYPDDEDDGGESDEEDDYDEDALDDGLDAVVNADDEDASEEETAPAEAEVLAG